MTSADLAAQRTASAAALESGAGEDTFVAFHHEMSGDGRASLFCSAWWRAEVRAGRIASSKPPHNREDYGL